MKGQWITVSVIVLGLAALWTPRQSPVAGAPSPDPEPTSAVGALRDGDAAESNGGETRLTRDDDGHFYADVEVDGRTVEMMVDTGASFIALTPEDADRAGVGWHENDAVVVGKGASGEVRGVPVVLDEVEVGDHRARDVQAAVIVDGLEVSLLGQSFLRHVDTVRIDGDRMVLEGG